MRAQRGDAGRTQPTDGRRGGEHSGAVCQRNPAGNPHRRATGWRPGRACCDGAGGHTGAVLI